MITRIEDFNVRETHWWRNRYYEHRACGEILEILNIAGVNLPYKYHCTKCEKIVPDGEVIMVHVENVRGDPPIADFNESAT